MENDFEKNVVKLADNQIFHHSKEMYEFFIGKINGFMLPYERIIYQRYKTYRKDFTFIMEVYIQNAVNSSLSSNLYIWYEEKTFSVYGYRDKVSVEESNNIMFEINRFSNHVGICATEERFVKNCNAILALNGFNFKEESIYENKQFYENTIKTILSVLTWKNYRMISVKRRIFKIAKSNKRIGNNTIKNISTYRSMVMRHIVNKTRIKHFAKFITYENDDGKQIHLVLEYLYINGFVICTSLSVSPYKSFIKNENTYSVHIIKNFLDFLQIFMAIRLKMYKMGLKDNLMSTKTKLKTIHYQIIMAEFKQNEKLFDNDIAKELARFIFELKNRMLYSTNLNMQDEQVKYNNYLSTYSKDIIEYENVKDVVGYMKRYSKHEQDNFNAVYHRQLDIISPNRPEIFDPLSIVHRDSFSLEE